MSERYGNCRGCLGTGKVRERHQDGLTGDVEYTTEECDSCGGTGHSGDALDYMQRES